MNWEDVLKRTDIVGGDFEAHEGGDIYRGPIKAIRLQDGDVDILLDWCAKTPGPGKPGSGEWRLHNMSLASVNAQIRPQDASDNRVLVAVPGLGTWVIFPKGGSKLDPAKVVGLREGG